MSITNPFELLLSRLDDLEREIKSLKKPDKPKSQSDENGVRLYTKKETAELLGVCQSTVDNYRRSGELTKINIGGVKFKKSEIIALVNRKQCD